MDRYEEGMAVRRAVLGDDYVDRAIADTNDLDADFQRWITETAWAGVWARPGLDQRSRSLLTIAILGALNHEELELHLRAGMDTGVTADDVKEVLFHVAVYAGVPAANRAFKVAKAIYAEET
jgi:4-carboxymuconolactone decarboxylase